MIALPTSDVFNAEFPPQKWMQWKTPVESLLAGTVGNNTVANTTHQIRVMFWNINTRTCEHYRQVPWQSWFCPPTMNGSRSGSFYNHFRCEAQNETRLKYLPSNGTRSGSCFWKCRLIPEHIFFSYACLSIVVCRFCGVNAPFRTLDQRKPTGGKGSYIHESDCFGNKDKYERTGRNVKM